jgi:hypothetical protein
MIDYSTEHCHKLEEEFNQLNLSRPKRFSRYDAGRNLSYKITSIDGKHEIETELLIEKFVGGGFAGQVYKVKLRSAEGDLQYFPELKIGAEYAVKILIPPSGFSRFFRNFIYRLGFGGPFQPQINPAAARTGAIWQKFIRLAASKYFNNEKSVVDIYGLFIDTDLGSCGEISEWIEGRTWWLEVNDHINLFSRNKNKLSSQVDNYSPEFTAKHKFMLNFVKLLHQMGAPEFARQYEWSTMKSQPNCLKRSSSHDNPDEGLVAVDFRAGLALLPLLPMSPGDFKLIINGFLRGSLVQFDRGNVKKLKKYLNENFTLSTDEEDLLVELERNELIYRNSVPDITHNHFKIFFSKKLWSGIFHSSRSSWKIRKLIDSKTEIKLSGNKLLMTIFYLIGLLPILGSFTIKLLGMKNWREHYRNILIGSTYFKKAIKGIRLEKLIKWHRRGQITEATSDRIQRSLLLFWLHALFSILPTGLHRFLTDKAYFKHKLYMIFLRPLKLYFDHDLREDWLRNMISEGKNKHMLSNDDADTILNQLNEPFIQKYLKSLAVHICTIPITQVVSVFLALLYVLTHPEMPRTQAWGIGIGIIALFQIIPISPGSLVRGLYVVYLVIKERNFKDYNIAVFLGFFKYIGYLAFPIQMTYKYPALARFMAGHWATEAVHMIPVFGEKGALLEHWIFDLFYNVPLTIRRQMSERVELRKTRKVRYWPIPLLIIFNCALFCIIDYYYLSRLGALPDVRSIWWLTILISSASGFILTRGLGGMRFNYRITTSIIIGLIVGIAYTVISYQMGFSDSILIEMAWRSFIITLFTSLGCIVSEVSIGENH